MSRSALAYRRRFSFGGHDNAGRIDVVRPPLAFLRVVSVQTRATAEALRAVCEVDLSESKGRSRCAGFQ
jgi:hypothetical protein